MFYDIGLNDVIEGTAAGDTLYGGEKNDVISGREGEDRVYGVAGDDILYGNQDNDFLYGDAGVDYLFGGQGNDALYGGEGNDNLAGGVGSDVIDGEAGVNTVSYSIIASGVTVNLNLGTATGGSGDDMLVNIQNVVGSLHADTLIGNAADNVSYGGQGSDLLSGGEGNDTLDGGTGGGSLGELTFDRPDLVKPGTKIIDFPTRFQFGPASHDLIANDNIADSTTIPHATVHATASGGVPEYYAFTFLAGTRLYLDIDNNSFNSLIQIVSYTGIVIAENDDSLDPGSNPGASFLDYTFSNNGYAYLRVLDRDNGTGPAAGSTYTLHISNTSAGVEYPVTSSAETDVLDGGAGIDTVSYESATSYVYVNLEHTGARRTGGGGTDNLISIENLVGSAFADYLRGNAGSNVLSGGNGGDELQGGAGDDVLLGGFGVDILYGDTGNDLLFGNQGNDEYMNGGVGDDQLFGGQGDDQMQGGEGNDILQGGIGSDVLSGDRGADIFRYVTVNDSPRIASDGIGGFQTGIDKIDFLALNTSAADCVSISNSGELALVTFDQGGTGLNQILIRVYGYNSGNAVVSVGDLLLHSAIVTVDGVSGVAMGDEIAAFGRELAPIDFMAIPFFNNIDGDLAMF